MRIAVMSIKRSGQNYLAGTLAQMSAKEPDKSLLSEVRVVCGSDDESHVPADQDRLPMPSDVWLSTIRKRGVERITVTMKRSLEWVLDGQQRHVMVLEDDLVFARGWLSKAIEHASFIRSNEYALALCTAIADGLWASDHTPVWRLKDPSNFWGQQAMLYTRGFAQAMLERIRMPGNMSHGDFVTKKVAQVHGWPIFCTNPSLAKHVGANCAWLASGKSHAYTMPTCRFVP